MKSTLDHVVKNLESLSIDEIKGLIEPHIRGMTVQSLVLPPGSFVYRARMLTGSFNKKAPITRADLIHPPAEKTPQGRLNRPGRPMLYASVGKEAPFFELPTLAIGSEVALSFWRTTTPLYVNNVGYTQLVFAALGAKRAVPFASSSKHDGVTDSSVSLPSISSADLRDLLSRDKNHEVRELLSEHFASIVNDNELYKYKLTTAIGELHLGELDGGALRFGGLLYPAIRMWANADNVALLPWFVENHLELTKVTHVRIDKRDATTMSTATLDHARRFDPNGHLIWAGQDMSWKLPPGVTAVATATIGKYSDGDYERTPTGDPVHWVIVDEATGKTIEPS